MRPPNRPATDPWTTLAGELPASLDQWESAALVDLAEKTGRLLAQQAQDKANSQVRNLYDGFIRIRTRRQNGATGSELFNSIQLLKPKIAYASSRAPAIRRYADFLRLAIDKMPKPDGSDRTNEAIDKLVVFAESIVQYFAYYSSVKKGGAA
jgi:CRISPR type III-A-associated protein Csm2